MISRLQNPIGYVMGLVKKNIERVRKYLGKRPHRSFRLTKRPRTRLGGRKLPSIWRQLVETNAFLRKEKRLLAKLGLFYAAAGLVFVGGVTQLDFLGFKEAATEFLGGEAGAFGAASALFFAAVTGGLTLPSNELQQFLGLLVTFFFWLALVWAARMRLAGNPVKARDALYNCGAPIVPSAVTVFIIVLQLLPAIAAGFIIATIQVGGVLTSGVEVMMFSIASTLLILLSAYWVSASLLSLVVVTLPGMYPWKALSVASELVIGQRWAMALRMAIMFVVICVLWGIVLLPALLLDGYLRFDWLPIVPVVVQLLGAASLIYASAYIYKLYRSLL